MVNLALPTDMVEVSFAKLLVRFGENLLAVVDCLIGKYAKFGQYMFICILISYLMSKTDFNFLIKSQSSLVTESRNAGSLRVSIDLREIKEYKLSLSST